MLAIDYAIIASINQYSRHSHFFDNVVALVADNHLFKGGVIIPMYWYLWFKSGEQQTRNRLYMVTTLLNCTIAMGIARAVALTSPFRLRPMHTPEVHFQLPYGVPPTALDGWSSFPSDHATLFFGLATGLLFASRTVGIFAIGYTALFISLPRIYLGFHYPTDIFAGAAIGALIIAVGNQCLAKNRHIQALANNATTLPHLFYPVFFLFTFQIAEMFESSRKVMGALYSFILKNHF